MIKLTPQRKVDIMNQSLSPVDISNMQWKAKQIKTHGAENCPFDKQKCHVLGGIGKGRWCAQCPRYVNSSKLKECKFMLNEDARELPMGRMCRFGGHLSPQAMCHQCKYYQRAKKAKFIKSTKLEETPEWKRFDKKFDEGVDIKHLINTGKTRYLARYSERKKMKKEKD